MGNKNQLALNLSLLHILVFADTIGIKSVKLKDKFFL